MNGTLVPENAMETQDTNVLSNGLPEFWPGLKCILIYDPLLGSSLGSSGLMLL